MLAKKLISLQHSLVKHWISLRLERSYREENQRLLLIGERPIRELKLPIHALITVDPQPDISAEEHYLITEAMMKKISGLQQPDGFAAEIALPPPQDLSRAKHLLILDEISDPGNLGTLLRTALGFNWEGAILTPKTVDLFNDKALRASRGASLYLPYARMDHTAILPLIEKMAVFTADLEGTPLDQISFRPPLALILSNEAKGPRFDSIGKKISIPMSPQVDSLNVASAGAILLYAMRTRSS